MKFVCPSCKTEFEVDENKYDISMVCCEKCMKMYLTCLKKGLVNYKRGDLYEKINYVQGS